MDKLTTGMRKIKINVVTAAQKEEREKAKRLAEAKKAEAAKVKTQPTQPKPKEKSEPVTPRLSATPLQPTAEVPVTPLAQTIGAPTLFLTEPEPEPQTKAPEAAPTEDLTLSVYSDIASMSDDHSPLLTPSETTDAESSVYGSSTAPAVFIPYQPDGTSTPQRPTAAPAALHWLPPNEINTPAVSRPSTSASASDPTSSPPMVSPVKMKRADLPVFTATSTIPFAPPGTSSRPPSSGQQ